MEYPYLNMFEDFGKAGKYIERVEETKDILIVKVDGKSVIGAKSPQGVMYLTNQKNIYCRNKYTCKKLLGGGIYLIKEK